MKIKVASPESVPIHLKLDCKGSQTGFSVCYSSNVKPSFGIKQPKYIFFISCCCFKVSLGCS